MRIANVLKAQTVLCLYLSPITFHLSPATRHLWHSHAESMYLFGALSDFGDSSVQYRCADGKHAGRQFVTSALVLSSSPFEQATDPRGEANYSGRLFTSANDQKRVADQI
jgi:hypothetical protein